MLTAFLIMISSAFSLYTTPPPADRTPVYINIAAMAWLIVVVTLLNFEKNKNKNF